MKGTVWLMQEKRWFLKIFCKKKRVPSAEHSLLGVWVKIGSNGMAAKIKSHLQGVWFWEATWGEIWAKEIPTSKSKGLYGTWRRTRELVKASSRVGRQKKDQAAISKVKRSLKDPQEEDILYQDILLQSKRQGTLVDTCMAIYNLGTVGGGSFKKMWPLAPDTL